jgi:peroxiredoxin
MSAKMMSMFGKVNLVLLLAFVSIGVFKAPLTQAQPKGYNIKVKITGIEDSVCYLGYHYGDQKYLQDTATVEKDGWVNFVGKKTLPTGVYFIYTPNKVFFEIIVKEPQFTLETNVENFITSMKVKGSPENLIFNDFQRFMMKNQKKADDLSKRMEKAKENKDSVELLRKEIAAINQEVKDFKTSLLKKHPETFTARLIHIMDRPEVPEAPKDANGVPLDSLFAYKYYRNHFFDQIDFASSDILRTPVFHGRLMEYFDKLIAQHPDSIAKAADVILTKAAQDKDVFRYVLVKLTHKYETSKIMGMDAVFVHLAENYYLKGKADWADEELLGKFRERVKELKPTLIGKKAPGMILMDTLFSQVSLYNIPAKYTVLYFYDPDCGHCKKKTPMLKDIYFKLKPKGVEVAAICTVTDIKKWKKYVKDNELEWLNLADPYYKSNFREQYSIKSTPVILILNEKKEIIARRIDVEDIEPFLEHYSKRKL